MGSLLPVKVCNDEELWNVRRFERRCDVRDTVACRDGEEKRCCPTHDDCADNSPGYVALRILAFFGKMQRRIQRGEHHLWGRQPRQKVYAVW